MRKELQQDAAESFDLVSRYLCPTLDVVFPHIELKQTYSCPTCKTYKDTRPYKIQLAHMSISDSRQDLRIQDILPFDQVETVHGENCYAKPCNCEMQDLHIYSPEEQPENMILQFGRFDTNHQKELDVVQYPFRKVEVAPSVQYMMQTIVCHVGRNTDTGHYYTRLRENDCEDGRWIRYDDDRFNEEVDRVEKIVTADAYLLFLKKKSLSPSLRRLCHKL